MRSVRPTAALLAAALMASPVGAEPAIRDGRLTVDGRPFVILGGELHNSSSTSTAYMAPVWDRLAEIGINTVQANVGWDQIEPQPGRFDFALVDDLIAQARRRDLRLVLMWFGGFKNARSTYVPGWVRADRVRYPRAVTRGSGLKSWELDLNPPPVLSVFGDALVAADARAFAALMRHVRAADRDGRVVMVQVENEVGLLGDSRDRSPDAERAWHAPVPATLIARFRSKQVPPALARLWMAKGQRSSGDWPTVFGSSPAADELFMAWHFARYVETVARAGRQETAIPFYANAWLGPQSGQSLPGDYPSGGPVAGMIDVWKAAAPTLALVGPDVYQDDAKGPQAAYARPDNPLFVPEEMFRPGSLFWALGQHRAIGMGMYDIDLLRPNGQTAAALRLLRPMVPLIAQAQAEGRIAGVLVEGEDTQTITLAGTTLTVHAADAVWRRRRLDTGASAPAAPPPGPSESLVRDVRPDRRAFGLIIALAPDHFLCVGQGFLVAFSRAGAPVEIDRIEEGRIGPDTRWIAGRWLGGDDYGEVVPNAAIGASDVRLVSKR